MAKELEDLTIKELLEDLGYWIQKAQYQSPSFTDSAYSCIWKTLEILFKKLVFKDEMSSL